LKIRFRPSSARRRLEATACPSVLIATAVAISNSSFSPKIRAIPLPGFTPITIGALWCGKTTPLLQTLLDELKLCAKWLV
jgi:hypothetical protein